MSFIEKNLANNEQIIYKANLHWWIYLKNILLIVVGVIIAGAAGSNTGGNAFGGLCVFVALIGLVMAYMRSKNSEFVVTNRRVIFKSGILSRKLVELQLNRAEGLSVDQGIIGRIFNYGTIVVRSGSVVEKFSPIANPYEFKKQINNAIEGSFSPISNPSMV